MLGLYLVMGRKIVNKGLWCNQSVGKHRHFCKEEICRALILSFLPFCPVQFPVGDGTRTLLSGQGLLGSVCLPPCSKERIAPCLPLLYSLAGTNPVPACATRQALPLSMVQSGQPQYHPHYVHKPELQGVPFISR